MATVSTRKAFTTASAATFATLGIIRSPARAAQFEFKCHTDFPPDHPTNVRLLQMWAAVEQESGGRIHTQVFPSAQLGSDTSVLAQVRAGAVEFMLAFPAILGSVVEAADIGQLGFAFKDEPEAIHALGPAPLGGYIRKEMMTKGLFAPETMWSSGMYTVSSQSGPITKPADFHGFKIRASASKITVDLFTNLGASVVTLGAAEIYTALETKLVDGTSTGIISVESMKLYEVQKYISLTNHAWSGFWLLTTTDIWNRLPPDLQAILDRNNTRYGLMNQRDMRTAQDATIARLRARGNVVVPVDSAPFVTALAPYYQEWAGIFGPTEWAMLQTSISRSLG